MRPRTYDWEEIEKILRRYEGHKAGLQQAWNDAKNLPGHENVSWTTVCAVARACGIKFGIGRPLAA